MKSVVVVAVVLVAAVSTVLPAKLPSYIKACRRNDPKLNECALKNGQEAIPRLIGGDAKLGIPKLDPLEIEKVVVGDSKNGKGLGITFSCHKCLISGLKDIKFTDAKFDLQKKHIELRGSVAKIGVNGRYTADGKVMILPIKGDGIANITLGDLKLTYKTDFDIQKGKDGKDYIHLKKPKLDFEAGKFTIFLTNLFNGDKTLGNQMNLFLNENWQEVLQEFGPPVEEVLGEIVSLIVNRITTKVPYDEIFLQ